MRANVVAAAALLLAAGRLAAARQHPRPSADAAPAAVVRPLVVGTTPSPPWSMKAPDGTWTGLTIEAWTRVATALRLPYEIREFPLADLNAPERWAERGIDVVPGYAVSRWSEERVEVTAPYITSGLTIATRAEPRTSVGSLARKISSVSFLKGVAVLFAVLLIVGTVVWGIERRHSPDEFGGHPLRGIASGAFWTLEALFGKSKSLSRTPASRLFGLIWTAVSVLLISGITAKLASELTVGRLSTAISGPADLPRFKVGSIKSPSVAAHYLTRRGLGFVPYENLQKLLEGLARGEVDAIVANAAQLRYRGATDFAGRISVLSGTFLNQGSGFALKAGSPLRKPINIALLTFVEGDEWPKLVARYLGGE
jgi:polar amino acid transport system substrate-binding protein